MSRRLPAYVAQFGKKRCFRTPYANYFVAAERLSDERFYVVYFRVSCCAERAGAVNLLVESAYVKRLATSMMARHDEESFTAIILSHALVAAK